MKDQLTPINEGTVRLITRILYPWKAEGVLDKAAYDVILMNLKHLAAKGTLFPVVVPKLIDQSKAADMLGISLSNFKRLERSGAFPFRRKLVGSAVRYRNVDIVKYIMEGEDDQSKIQETCDQL